MKVYKFYRKKLFCTLLVSKYYQPGCLDEVQIFGLQFCTLVYFTSSTCRKVSALTRHWTLLFCHVTREAAPKSLYWCHKHLKSELTPEQLNFFFFCSLGIIWSRSLRKLHDLCYAVYSMFIAILHSHSFEIVWFPLTFRTFAVLFPGF